MKYMIHACNKRLWYVENFLLPSMLEQGIRREKIEIWLDELNEGCLPSFYKSMTYLGNLNNEADGVWHLQDDVCISKDFKEKTEAFHHGIVCGFCSQTFSDDETKSGEVKNKDMWYSFPCIRIPNAVAYRFAKWYEDDVIHNEQYRMWVKAKKFDDSLFRIFVEDYYEGYIYNLNPNIVDHVDYLIGGSVLNVGREGKWRSKYWNDNEAISKLEHQLVERAISYADK